MYYFYSTLIILTISKASSRFEQKIPPSLDYTIQNTISSNSHPTRASRKSNFTQRCTCKFRRPSLGASTPEAETPADDGDAVCLLLSSHRPGWWNVDGTPPMFPSRWRRRVPVSGGEMGRRMSAMISKITAEDGSGWEFGLRFGSGRVGD